MKTPEYTETVNQGDVYVDIIPVDPNFDTVYSSGSVDTDTPGDYVITYTFMSLSPFATKTESKKVTVLSSIPVITLVGSSVVFLGEGEQYVEPGASTNVGTLNIIKPQNGTNLTSQSSYTYTIIYHAQNKGFSSFATRSVVVNNSAVNRPSYGLDINEINVLFKPAAGLDVTSITAEAEPVSRPATGLDITSITAESEPVSRPAAGLDITSITAEAEPVSRPAAGLDVASIQPERPLIGPLYLVTSDNPTPAPATGFSINSVYEDGTPDISEGLELVNLHVDGEPDISEGLELVNLHVDGEPDIQGFEMTQVGVYGEDSLPTIGFSTTLNTHHIGGARGNHFYQYSALIDSNNAVSSNANTQIAYSLESIRQNEAGGFEWFEDWSYDSSITNNSTVHWNLDLIASASDSQYSFTATSQRIVGEFEISWSDVLGGLTLQQREWINVWVWNSSSGNPVYNYIYLKPYLLHPDTNERLTSPVATIETFSNFTAFTAPSYNYPWG